MPSGTRVAPKLFFLLFTAYFLHLPAFAHGGVSGGSTEMKPVVSLGLRSMLPNETRRRLGSFQVCAVCTCCGGSRGLCLPSPCCYAINCNIPNRPFGFCSFTPKACNCFGCSL